VAGREMKKVNEILKQISIDNMKTHIRKLEGVRHPIKDPEALEKAYQYIWDQLQSWGYEMKEHQFLDVKKVFKNVIGMKPGIIEPEKIIIVIAHFDTVANSPGANDNASGVAAMLEAARALSDFQFHKSIYFVGINQEEQREDGVKGSPICRGSNALAAHAREHGWEIEGVIDFEEIGYAGDEIIQEVPENFPVEVPRIGNFIGVIANENSIGMVRMYGECIQEYKIPLPYVPLVVPGNGEILPDSRRSDHAPFWDRGYPAIMLTDTANFRFPHYHEPSDTLDKVNVSFATEVCRSGCCLAYKMARFFEDSER